MDSQQIQHLISLPKKIVESNILLSHKNILLQSPFSYRFPLLSEEDEEYSFFVEVYQSSKNFLKVTLHFQEDNANYGLLRVDYGGRHKNPEKLNDCVPEVCRPYCGHWLMTPHIHLAVEGYKPLAWAVPLTEDPFPVKELNSTLEISTALSAFFQRINVLTQLTITVQTDAFS